MEDNIGGFIISGDSIKESEEFFKIYSTPNNSVYEVVRIIGGVPLFLEDHFERLRNSIEAKGNLSSISLSYICDSIKKLIKANCTGNCNVKLITNEAGELENTIFYISKSYYPSEQEFSSGVRLGLIRLERHNPNVKVMNQAYRETVSKKILEDNVFEVLLVSRDGMITEGSKSNVFFLKNNRVYTAPEGYVLKGITRKYAIEACQNAGIEIVEELVPVDGLLGMDAAFISGTSIKVLPIASVEEHSFNSGSHPAIVRIRREYDKMIDEYIKARKQKKK